MTQNFHLLIPWLFFPMANRQPETISMPIMSHLVSTNLAVVPGPIMNNKDKSSVTLVLNTHLADRYEPGLEVIYVATPNCKRIWKF